MNQSPHVAPASTSDGFGVRGYTMLLCAFIWALVGYAIIRGSGSHVPGTFHDEVPTWGRLVMWFTPAAASVLLCRSRRFDWIALAMLIVGPTLRCVSYLIAWTLAIVPGGKVGYGDGWYSAAIYLALIGLVGIAAVTHRLPTPKRDVHEGDRE